MSAQPDTAIRSTMAELTRRAARDTPLKETLESVTAAAVELVDALRAFDLLRRLSQEGNTPLHQIARDLIARGPDRRGEAP